MVTARSQEGADEIGQGMGKVGRGHALGMRLEMPGRSGYVSDTF